MPGKKSPLVVVILDGFGWREETDYNAVVQAKKPTFDFLWSHYPHTLLQASGTAVGLPTDTPGNSEVGHMTIGAGRIIEQSITIINHAIEDGSFFKNPVLQSHLHELQVSKRTLHIIGLLSNGNVHGSEKHIYAYIKAAHDAGVSRIVVHAILDGRDVAPRSAARYLEDLDTVLKKTPGAILGSVIGRFYAMDRDENWQRTEQAYKCLVEQKPIVYDSWKAVLDHYYAQDITDEFIPPTQLNDHCVLQDGDGVLCSNIRPDRAQQLLDVIVNRYTSAISTHPLKIAFLITPVPLDHWPYVSVLYPSKPIPNTLKEILNDHNKTIFCIAESEKYAHISYFLAGGRDKPFEHEQRVLISSIKARNYIQEPHMSANTITSTVIGSLKQNPHDVYFINYANADMVGHSGDLAATIKAIECLDEQLKILYEQVIRKMNGIICVLADHGNAELKYDVVHQQVSKSHTTNMVPFIWVDEDEKDRQFALPLKGLADVAPFILKYYGFEIPLSMKRQ